MLHAAFLTMFPPHPTILAEVFDTENEDECVAKLREYVSRLLKRTLVLEDTEYLNSQWEGYK